MKLTLFCDGATRGNPGASAIGVLLLNARKEKAAEISLFLGERTNNQAEYLALLAGLKKAAELNARELEIFLDSKLVVEQVAGRWKIKDLELRKLAEKTHALLTQFQKWEIRHIPREKNRAADRLANQALDVRGFTKQPVHLSAPRGGASPDCALFKL